MKKETLSTVINGVTYYYSTAGTPQGSRHERNYICDLCGMPFRDDQVVKFRGKVYCVPNTCYKDIAGIVRKERNQKNYSAQQESEWP